MNTIQFAQHLWMRGFNPIVAEIGKPVLSRLAHERGVTTIQVAATNFSDVGWSQWHDLLRNTYPDIVVRSKGWWRCVNWRLDLLVRLKGAKYLGWEHHPAAHPSTDRDMPPTSRFSQFVLCFKRRIRWRIHNDSVWHSIAVSNAVRNPLIDHFGVVQKKIEVIYPGIDFSEFNNQHSERPHLHSQWQLPPDAIVIGSLGRLVPHKRNELVLEVFSALVAADPTANLWCVIAGAGPDLARLQRIADALGIAHRVRFPGWQARAAATWSAIDVFLMTSSDEGLGMALIEAASCGCLPLAIAGGGMLEVLDGPLKEYRIEPPVVASSFAKIQQLLTLSVGERQQRVHDAVEYLRSRFDATQQWDRMVNQNVRCSE